MTHHLLISLLFFLFPLNFFTEMAMAENTKIPVKVGVVLDLDTWDGKMGLNCISMALSDFYASHRHYNTRMLESFKNKTSFPTSDGRGFFKQFILKKAPMNK